VDDGTGTGGTRLASGAFQDISDETGATAMSVLVLRKVSELGGAPQDVLSGEWKEWGLVGFPAGVAREKGLRLFWAPSQKEGHYSDAHVHVFGNKSGSVQKRLVEASTRYVWPENGTE
jgi:hypothetical protein